MKRPLLSVLVACICSLLLTTTYVHATVTIIKNENEFNSLVKNSHQPILVQFSASWCGVCKGVKKPFQEISEEKEFQHVQFANVDIDTCKSLSQSQSIIGVPTFVFMHHGSKKEQITGVANTDNFADDMRKTLRTHFPLAQNSTQKPEQSTMSPLPAGAAPQVALVSTAANHEQPTTAPQTQEINAATQQGQSQPTPVAQTQQAQPTESGILDSMRSWSYAVGSKIKDGFTYSVDKVKSFFK